MIRPHDSHVRVAKRLYFEMLRVARADSRAMRRHAAQDHLLILNLQSVSPETNPYAPSLHPHAFADFLAWLQKRATVIALGDLSGPRRRDRRRPLVVLPFDDGLKDFVEHAMPILAGFGLRANQNVIGEAVEKGKPPWAIRLVDLLGAADFDAVRRLRLPGFAHRLRSEDPFAKERFGRTPHEPLQGAVAGRSGTSMVGAAVRAEGRRRRVAHPDDVLRRRGGCSGSRSRDRSHAYSHESMEYLDDDAFLEDSTARAPCWPG